MKYTTVKINGIITQIAETTDVKGYTAGVLEAFLPDEDEMKGWTKKHEQLWITRNNKRMEAICELLNERGL
jgi:hypothetical protein